GVVSAEERAARLGQKPAVIALDRSIFAHADQLERALLQQGIVALARPAATAAELSLLQVTGVALLIADTAQADATVSATLLDEVVEQVAQLVRL
ncbi:MAG: hypothetical protein ACEQSD_04615, partial [Flavobacteriales bacterium]